MSTDEITVGIDIGTSSVKAVAADGDGRVVARSRVPHGFAVPSPGRFENDAARAWSDGPRAALEALGDIRPRGMSVSAMVPSLTAVDDRGVPCSPGLLYGDERGYTGSSGDPTESGELLQFLRWTAAECPGARGYWPAHAVANFAIAGVPLISTTAATTALPLFDWTGWDADVAAAAGASVEQLPEIAPSGQPAARVAGYDDCVLEAGTIDALGEQIVAGADEVGDVLVVCGTTLIVWAVVPGEHKVAGYYSVPHTAPGGKYLVGGPSNCGGLFLDWVRRMLADEGPDPDPANIPVWVPYPRGERVPLADPTRRAELSGLDLTHGAPAARRAAYEAAGFVTRRVLDASPVPARRIVATGGGVHDEAWLGALADCTGLPVDVVAVAEGAALGAAFLARVAAGLEESMTDASRWARIARRIEPDARWADAAARRYERFREVAG